MLRAWFTDLIERVRLVKKLFKSYFLILWNTSQISKEDNLIGDLHSENLPQFSSTMTNNIAKYSLEDLVRKGEVRHVARKLETTIVSIDDENYQDYYLVITALSNKHIKLAKFLMDRGFRFYKKFKPHAEKTPLHYALEFADINFIEAILKHGAGGDVTTCAENGISPLHLAIQREEIRVLKLLIPHATMETLNNMLLLHYCVKKHNTQLLKTLIRKGLSPLQKNENNETAFCIAIKQDSIEILYILWQEYHQMADNQDSDNVVGLMFVAIIVDQSEYITDYLDGSTMDITIPSCSDGWALFQYFAGYSLLHCAVKYLRLEIVNLLVDNHADLLIQDVTGSTPFHIALELKEQTTDRKSDRYKAIKKIIELLFYATQERYYNIVNNYNISHFHLVCTLKDTETVKRFLKHGASISDTVSLNSPISPGFSPLHFAAKYNRKPTVNVLLRRGANIEQEAYFRMSPLHIAARESSLEVAKLLIKRGADITKQDSNGNTPVHYAFEAKNYEVLDFLLSVHAIITRNPVNSRGLSHFHIACSRTDLSIVANLLSNGASVNTSVKIDPSIQYLKHNDEMDWCGCSPLHFAAAFSRSVVAEYLLVQNADLEATDARGLTPFHLACQYTWDKFGELIMNNLDTEENDEYMDGDHRIFEDDFIDVAVMEKELKMCHPYDFLQVCDEDEASEIIDWASNRKDHVKTIELFISKNCDVNRLDMFGNAPLFYMIYFNMRKIRIAVNYGIKCKSLLEMLSMKSFLKEMCYRRQVLLNCLFKNNKVNMDKCYENSPILHYLALRGEYNDPDRIHVIKILLNEGANINATNDKMETALHLATKGNDPATVYVLLEYNANLDCIESGNSATPLHIAASSFSQESLRIVYLLLMGEADVNLKQSDGSTPLHNFLSKPRDYDSEFRPIFELFMKLGVDLNAVDNRGRTPLFVACTIVNSEIVEELLRYGADVSVKNREGENIFQYVYGQIKTVKVAYNKINNDMIHVFWILLEHEVKLRALNSVPIEECLKMWSDVQELVRNWQIGYQKQALAKFKTKCLEELARYDSTKIHNDITMRDLLFKEDYEMMKFLNNDALKTVLESPNYEETHSCYGYLLTLKVRRGSDRRKLLPDARKCLGYLTCTSLPNSVFEDIFRHLNNCEIRQFIKAVNVLKRENKSSTLSTSSKVIKDYSKYSILT